MIILGYLGGYSLNYNPTPDITVIKHLCAIQTLQVDSWHKITQNLINAKTTNIPHSHHYTINHVRTRRDSVSSIFQQLIWQNIGNKNSFFESKNRRPEYRKTRACFLTHRKISRKPGNRANRFIHTKTECCLCVGVC
jgi:hypothetical protein